MKIVVLDGYALNPGDLSWNSLASLGELAVYDRTAEEAILSRAKDADVLFTNKTPLTRETLSNCKNLKYIGVLATGYNVVDVAAATELNITVTNIPTYETGVVGQYAIALLIEIASRVAHQDKRAHEGTRAEERRGGKEYRSGVAPSQ